MAVFDFNDYVLELTIAGNDFKVNCTAEMGDKVAEHGKSFAKLAEEIKAGNKMAAHVVSMCREVTDDILGAGAFKAIFKGRTPNVMDCSDVLKFVMGEMTERYKKQGNREARRAATKTKPAGGKK